MRAWIIYWHELVFPVCHILNGFYVLKAGAFLSPFIHLLLCLHRMVLFVSRDYQQEGTWRCSSVFCFEGRELIKTANTHLIQSLNLRRQKKSTETGVKRSRKNWANLFIWLASSSTKDKRQNVGIKIIYGWIKLSCIKKIKRQNLKKLSATKGDMECSWDWIFPPSARFLSAIEIRDH